MLLVGYQKGYIVLIFLHYILFFFHSIKLSRYRIGIKFDNESLIVEQHNYTSKIVNLTLSMT